MMRQHLLEGDGQSYEYRVDGGWVLFRRLDHEDSNPVSFAEYTFTDMKDYITFHVSLIDNEFIFRLQSVIQNDIRLEANIDFLKMVDVFRSMTPTVINAMSTIWHS